MPKQKMDKSLNLGKKIIFFAAGFFAVMNFKLAYAEDYKYFLAPPPNYYLYQLQTKPQITQFQIVGSISPLSLIINGQVVKLNSVGKTNETFVKIQDKEVSSSGKNKTFFLEHEQLKQVDKIVIQIGTQGILYQYQIPLSKSFLDFPIRKSIYTKKDHSLIEFNFSGKINSQDNFSLDNVTKKQVNDKITISKEFQLGEQILTGSRNQEIINLPIEVSKTKYQENSIYLIIKKEIFNDIKITGQFIEGRTTPNADLEIDSHKVKVNEKGYFKYFYIPKDKSNIVHVKIRNQYEMKELDLTLTCSEFEKGFPWYSQPRRIQNYIEFGFMEDDRSYSDDVKIDGDETSHQKIKLLKRTTLQQDYEDLLGFEFYETYNHFDDQTSFNIKEDLRIIYRRNFYIDWGWIWGPSVIARQMRYSKAGNDCNFCENFQTHSLHLGVFGGKRFKVLNNFEWVPQIAIEKAVTYSLYKHSFHFEFLNFRYFY